MKLRDEAIAAELARSGLVLESVEHNYGGDWTDIKFRRAGGQQEHAVMITGKSLAQLGAEGAVRAAIKRWEQG